MAEQRPPIMMKSLLSKHRKHLFLWLAILALGILLTLVDGKDFSWRAWIGITLCSALCAYLTWWLYRWVNGEEGGRALKLALLVAFILRLVVGLTLDAILPSAGYDNRHQNAGYFFPDAHLRDRDAWFLAESQEPLTLAFSDEIQGDQYGGMLFSMASLYRLASPDAHRPALTIFLSAWISVLSVLFTWAFTRNAFGLSSARLAAWIVALLPEAVLLGASQMREPFMILGAALALYGYALLQEGNFRRGSIAGAAGLILSLFVSPPQGLLILFVLLVAWIWQGAHFNRRTLAVVAVAVLLVVVAGMLTVRAWSGIENSPADRIGRLLEWWLLEGAEYELYKLEQQSGVFQALFEIFPDWAHAPLATGYGLVQPFLPAALTDPGGSTMATVISIWRSSGWFAMLPLLIYAPFAAFRKKGWRSLAFYLACIIWVLALLASFRAAGDQWDNPRYRAMFTAGQAAVAAWAWTYARQNGSPWLRRTILIVAVSTLLVVQWYLARYYPTPRLDLFPTIAVIGLFSLITIGWGLYSDRRKNQAS
jgi:hypothetical protein